MDFYEKFSLFFEGNKLAYSKTNLLKLSTILHIINHFSLCWITLKICCYFAHLKKALSWPNLLHRWALPSVAPYSGWKRRKKKNSLNFSLFTISNSCFPKFSTQQLSYMGGTLKNADWKCSLSAVIFPLRASSWADS